MNLKKYTNRICIRHEGIIYKLFSIGFYKDGGFFISDMGNEKFIYLVKKFRTQNSKTNSNGMGMAKTSNKNTYSTKSRKPKISHHMDGTAHISGEGITSGYKFLKIFGWKFLKRAKGLSIKSFPLIHNNDGGPVFIFNISLDILNQVPVVQKNYYKQTKKIFSVIFGEGPMCLDLKKGTGTDFAYCIEGYYIHKSELPRQLDETYIHIKHHPKFGLIPLVPIFTPSTSPYIFGIHLSKEYALGATDIYSFGAAPGKTLLDGNWEQLYVFLDRWNENDLPRLDR